MQINTLTAETLKRWCESLSPDTPVAVSLHGALHPIWQEHLGRPEPIALDTDSGPAAVMDVAVIGIDGRKLELAR